VGSGELAEPEGLDGAGTNGEELCPGTNGEELGPGTNGIEDGSPDERVGVNGEYEIEGKGRETVGRETVGREIVGRSLNDGRLLPEYSGHRAKNVSQSDVLQLMMTQVSAEAQTPRLSASQIQLFQFPDEQVPKDSADVMQF